MLGYEPPLEPPYNLWEEYEKPIFINNKIKEICHSIAVKGENGEFSEIFDLLYEYIDDKIEKFLPVGAYDYD